MKQRFTRLSHDDHKNLKKLTYKTMKCIGLRFFMYKTEGRKSLAVIVPKKKVHLAVSRYSLKRSIREVCQQVFSGTDMIIVAVLQDKDAYKNISYEQKIETLKKTIAT